ncbi:hypothetical protein FLJU110815_02800 [Flavobacterium jumunjinense]
MAIRIRQFSITYVSLDLEVMTIKMFSTQMKIKTLKL